MSTSPPETRKLDQSSVLVVGVGGLGCPATLALVRAGIGRVVLADDDVVDVTNLHRQILFDDEDVGRHKLEAACRSLSKLGSKTDVVPVRSRLVPENAVALVSSVDVVVEGADNFATKFLAADACRLARVPIVQGSAVRWRATAWAVGPDGAPCYRCLFEDLPTGDAQPNCEEAGIMGPVAGIAGALMADLALRVLAEDGSVFDCLHTYDGLSDRFRAVAVRPRRDCALCGPSRTIFSIEETRYTGASCAA